MKSLTTEKFNIEIQSCIPVLVEFFNASCTICAKAEMFMIELEHAYQGKLFTAKIDIADSLVFIDLYAISKVPTFVLFKAGKELTRYVGFRDKMSLEKVIRKHLI